MVCIKLPIFADFVCMVHNMYGMVQGVIPFLKSETTHDSNKKITNK